MKNPIQELVNQRVKGLLVEVEKSRTIHHNTTKGSLREEYLKYMFTQLLPKDCRISSGFIVNSHNKDMSNQLDMIISDKNAPDFSLYK